MIQFWRENRFNFLRYLASRFLPEKDEEFIFNNGISMVAPKGSHLSFLLWEIWHRQVYNPAGFELRPEYTVIDIGSNVGVFSIMAAKKCRRVISMEPASLSFSYLKRNAEENSLRNLDLRNIAISSKEGKIELYKGSNILANSTKMKNNGEIVEIVNATTLSIILKEIGIVDFIKMDCEGEEFSVFRNLGKEELSRIRMISMEYHEFPETGKVDELIMSLERFGFDVKIVKAGGSNLLYAKQIVSIEGKDMNHTRRMIT